MNWEAIGAVGEVLGAAAVVATLLYLAKEIRQNSRSLEITALRDTTAQWNHWSNMLASSPDLADIVARGNKSFKGLTESESLRYGAFVQSFFDNAESYRRLVIDNHVDRDLTVLESIVARRLLNPGFAEWWGENAADYDDGFVSWVEDKLRTSLPGS